MDEKGDVYSVPGDRIYMFVAQASIKTVTSIQSMTTNVGTGQKFAAVLSNGLQVLIKDRKEYERVKEQWTKLYSVTKERDWM